MDSGDAIRLCILIVFLFLSAFFSSAETALTTVNRIRLKNLADDGDSRAQAVLRLTENPKNMLSAILIGNNIVNLYASSLATMLVTDIWGSRAVGLATGLLTLFILVFGEVAPKTASTLYSEEIALRVGGIIRFCSFILTPVIWLVNRLAFLLLRLLRLDLNRRGDTITEEELRTMVEESHREGEIETGEKELINNVFDFGDAVARDIMVPRVDMIFVDAGAGYGELMEIFRREKYTRFPVCEGGSDHVIGIINIKDVFLDGGEEDFRLKDFLRQPLYTYELKKVSELMLEMQQKNLSVAIVLDEYGVTAGLVTLEDMLEEIVGEIRDEYDADEKDEVRKVGEREYLVEGSLNLDDLNDRLGLSLESEDFDSVGGLIIGMLDHLPAEGESVTADGVSLRVEKVTKNRIDQVRVTLSREDREPESGGK